MRKIVNALAESGNLCILAQASTDHELAQAGWRVAVLLEAAAKRVIELKEGKDAIS